MDRGMLTTLIDAHYWAHREMFRSLASLTEEQYSRQVASSFPSLRETVAHIVMGEEFLLGGLPGAAVARTDLSALATPAAAASRLSELEAFCRAFVADLGRDVLEQKATLTFRSGRTAQVQVWQVLHQLVTHGPYHRGQVVTQLHHVGGTPAKTDALLYYIQNGQ